MLREPHIVIGLALLITLGPAVAPALAGSQSSPNITDDTGEGDPRTMGLTPLPENMDIDKAWIQVSPNDPDVIEFHLKLASLDLPIAPASTLVFNRLVYEFQFEPSDPNSVFSGDCAGEETAFVHFATSSGLLDPTLLGSLSWGCLSDAPSMSANFDPSGKSGVEVLQDQDTLVFKIPRSTQQEGGAQIASPNLSEGTVLQNPRALVYQQETSTALGLLPSDVYDEAGPGIDQQI